MSATAHVSILGGGRLVRARSDTDAGPARVLVAFLLLSGYGVFRWATLLQSASAARLLGLVALAGCVAALGGAARATRARVRLGAGVAITFLSVAMLPVSGIPLGWLLELRFELIAQAISHGISTLPGVLVPYRGGDPWTRTVIVLGAGMLMLGGALTLVTSRRPRLGQIPSPPSLGATSRAGTERVGVVRLAGAALPLVVLATVPAALATPLFAWLHGLTLLVLLALFVLSENIPANRLGAATGFVAVAALGALALAPAFAGHQPWIRFTTLASRLGPTTEQFNWSQTYGPLAWPQDGVTALEVRARHAANWKAENLDAFDGRAWVQTRSALADSLPMVTPRNLERWTQTVTIRFAAIDTRQLITAGTTVGTSAGRTVTRGRSPGTYRAAHALPTGFQYQAVAYTPKPTPAQLAASGSAYPTQALAPDLRIGLPATARAGHAAVQFASFGSSASIEPFDDRSAAQESALLRSSPYGRAYALARALKAGSGSPYGFVEAVMRHLAHGYVYDQSPPASRYPLAYFLFGDHRGYCQQFAGAMALLLRMGGVPARVADGFTTGAYNPATGEYAVSDLNAHAWVEAWFPNYGWVPFDPTPAIDPALAGDSAGGLGAGAAPAASGNQVASHRKPLGGGAATAGRRPRSNSQTGAGTAILAALVAVLALVGLAAPVRLLARDRSAPSWRLEELERALARCGHPLEGGVTLAKLETSFQDAPAAAEYVRRVRCARFADGGPSPTPAQRRALRRRLSRGRGIATFVAALIALPPLVRDRS